MADRLVLIAGGRVTQAGPLAQVWPRLAVLRGEDAFDQLDRTPMPLRRRST